MRKILAGLGILSLVLAVAGPVLAADEAGITATVTAQLVSVTVSPESVDYGTLGFTESATSSTFTATNNGNVDEVFNVKGANASLSGGGSWTLNETAIGVDQFRHSVTGTSPVIAEKFLTISTSASWSGTIILTGTQQFTSKFYMPDAGSSGAGKIATTSITVVATEAAP